MESELIFTLPVGIFMLVVLARRPIVEFFGPIKERRKVQRRDDKRMKRFRRQGCSLDMSETDEHRDDAERCNQSPDSRCRERRNQSQDSRRRERRALERIKRI